MDDETIGLVSDPLVVGNDLFGCPVLYRDEGATDLNSIGEVNALPGAYDNYDADPASVDPLSGDYHLQPASPAVDAGHENAILAQARIEARVRDGDGDGEARPDTGADER